MIAELPLGSIAFLTHRTLVLQYIDDRVRPAEFQMIFIGRFTDILLVAFQALITLSVLVNASVSFDQVHADHFVTHPTFLSRQRTTMESLVLQQAVLGRVAFPADGAGQTLGVDSPRVPDPQPLRLKRHLAEFALKVTFLNRVFLRSD